MGAGAMNQLAQLSDIPHARVADNAGVKKRGWYGDQDWWTAERSAEMTKLWATGKPAEEIGRAMGTSKNAIVGKARRLNLPMRRGAPVKRHLDALSFDKLSREECRFPFGDPKANDFHFCGAPPVPGKPYCQTHCALCYVPGSTKAAA